MNLFEIGLSTDLERYFIISILGLIPRRPGKFQIQTFTSRNDMVAHLIGAVLMGCGGVLSLGCTIGQGVTGMSTLALGSLITLGSIIFGGALTMKVQYYQMDDQPFLLALRSSLADMRLLPAPK